MTTLLAHGSWNAALSRLALLGALATPACVPVERLPLTKPAMAQSGGLTIEVPTVGASTSFLAQRGGDWSVIATTLSVNNRGTETYVVELDHATLVLSDPGNELPDTILPVMAAGPGPVPQAIPLDDRPVPISLSPGAFTTSWVAFRARDPLAEPDLRRRIVLHIPISGGGPPIEVVLADPSVEKPRWTLATVTRAGYAGVSASGTFDESSIGVLRTSPKSVVGPVVLAPAFELGARAGKVRGEREPTIVCCDLGLSFDVIVPVARNTWTSFGPTLGYHGVFALEDGRTDKATWHGPSAGLTFFTSLIAPRTAAALPVRTTASVLGYSAFSVQYVHWFRRGDEGGSPGGFLTFERTFPEW